jgi:spectrin beta
VTEEAGRLASLFPDAREHIEVKHEDTQEAWEDLLEKSAQRRNKLQQAEQLQAYFDEYRDLMLVPVACAIGSAALRCQFQLLLIIS